MTCPGRAASRGRRGSARVLPDERVGNSVDWWSGCDEAFDQAPRDLPVLPEHLGDVVVEGGRCCVSAPFARVGKSEAGVAGRSFGERRGEDGDVDVVVVVDFCGLLAGVCAQDAAVVLDEASLERDRSGKEQSVECGTVEPFADEVAGGDDEERSPVV